MRHDITRVPFFLFADSPEELQKLCFHNNLTNESMFDYHVISPNPDQPKWGVWFMASAERYKRPEPMEIVDRKGMTHG